jgi:hypothetical protein
LLEILSALNPFTWYVFEPFSFIRGTPLVWINKGEFQVAFVPKIGGPPFIPFPPLRLFT